MTDDLAGATRTDGSGLRAAAEARLRALSDIGRAATSTPAGDRLRRVLDAARGATGAASVSLGVWQEEVQLLKTVMNLGDLADWEEEVPEDEAYPADQSTWLAGMAEGHLGLVSVVGDPETPADEQEFLLSLGKHSSMSVPVLLEGAWWGELFFSRRADQPPFGGTDLEWGTAVAAQVGAALEAMEHLDRIDRLAHTDPLTGLANRRAVDEWLDDAMVRLREQGAGLSLVVADVNALKRINDDQGHDAGDRALVAFARLVDKVAGQVPGALTARLGGDEFCIVAVDVEPDTVVVAAEELAQRGWEQLPDGVSVGVVSTGDPVGPVDSAGRLFRLADAAQYRAKRTRSRHPVVAGRSLPEDAAVPLAASTENRAPDRRLIRGVDSPDELHLVEAGMRALDQAVDEPVGTRLGLVADLVAHQLDAVGWWLSLARRGADEVTTVEFAIYRALPGLEREELQSEIGASFALDDYPTTRVALRGAAYQLAADDPTTDPAERAILDGLGSTGLVAAGGVDDEQDRWLVEVFTDGLSRPVRSLPTVLRLLVLAALHPAAPI
jgi:diguanylate cyclase (GGDEF)-like protein